MPMTPEDKILFTPRGSAGEAIAAVMERDAEHRDDVKEYLTEIYRLTAKVKFDPSILVAQAVHETNWFRSKWWRERRNPAGIGITGDEEQDAASFTWRNGRDAARAHVVHMAAYVYGGLSHPNPIRPDHPIAGAPAFDLAAYASLNPRWINPASKEWAGTIRTINKLTGRWATDRLYAKLVASRGNEVFPSLPNQGKEQPAMSVTFGLVPHPGFLDRLIVTKPENVGWNNLGQRRPKFLALHRMVGTLWGTDGYFRNPSVGALTDYGVGVKAIDGAQNAGVIIRWANPRGYMSGWASGTVSAPYGDGKAIIDKYGINAVNRDGVSVEISGYYDTPIDDVAFAEIVKLCAYWCDQMEIPWDEMPINPVTQISAFIWHHEFTAGTGKQCPCGVVKARTQELIDKTADLMRIFQEREVAPAPPPPTPKPPVPVPDVGRAVYPKGMGVQIARAYYGYTEAPDGDLIRFDLKGDIASRHWLRRYASQIPEGGHYKDVPWPGLFSIAARGDGGWDYQWTDGHIYYVPKDKLRKVA